MHLLDLDVQIARARKFFYTDRKLRAELSEQGVLT